MPAQRADQLEGLDGPEENPPGKQQRVAFTFYFSFYSEISIQYFSIFLTIINLNIRYPVE